MSRSGIDSSEFDEFRRDLRGMADALPREIEQASGDVAQFIATDARARAEARGGVAAHVAPSVRADGSTVGVGDSSYPMAAGAEMGGGGRPTTQQFQPYTSEGYFLYPAIRASDDRVEGIYLDHIDDLTKRYDLE